MPQARAWGQATYVSTGMSNTTEVIPPQLSTHCMCCREGCIVCIRTTSIVSAPRRTVLRNKGCSGVFPGTTGIPPGMAVHGQYCILNQPHHTFARNYCTTTQLQAIWGLMAQSRSAALKRPSLSHGPSLLKRRGQPCVQSTRESSTRRLKKTLPRETRDSDFVLQRRLPAWDHCGCRGAGNSSPAHDHLLAAAQHMHCSTDQQSLKGHVDNCCGKVLSSRERSKELRPSLASAMEKNPHESSESLRA